jgi:hypothetical protein
MKDIKETLNTILDNYIEGKIKDDTELTELLREESKGSSVLFYLLIEKMFELAFGRNIVILSKGLLKYYFKSEVKENDAFVFVGRANNEYVISWADKTLIVNILEKLKMEKTIDAYGHYVSFRHPEETNPDFFRQPDVKKFKDIESVIHVFLKEFDSVVPIDKRYIKFENSD